MCIVGYMHIQWCFDWERFYEHVGYFCEPFINMNARAI